MQIINFPCLASMTNVASALMEVKILTSQITHTGWSWAHWHMPGVAQSRTPFIKQSFHPLPSGNSTGWYMTLEIMNPITQSLYSSWIVLYYVSYFISIICHAYFSGMLIWTKALCYFTVIIMPVVFEYIMSMTRKHLEKF